jgi:nucleoid DNA-binding protein/uncharacterized membrane protein YciS (DUF1049 family)
MSKLSDIAKVLVAKYNLSQSEAENFLEQFNNLIGDALKTDRIVKIKGLGTFRVTKINSRESVDVNTGERIVIDGRDKISFVPDTAMRDLVNGPFAQFSTVVINEGVDFSEIDEKYKNGVDESEDTVEEIQQNDENDDDLPDTEVEDSLPVVENIPTEDVIEPEKPVEVKPEKPVEVEPDKSVEDESHPIEPVIEAQIPVEKTPEVETPVEKPEPELSHITPELSTKVIPEPQPKKSVEPENNPTELETTSSDENEFNKDKISEEVHSHKTILRIMAFALGFVVLLCIAGAFYFSHQLSLRDHRIENLEAQTNVNKKSVAKSQQSSATSDENSSTTLSPDSINNIQQREAKKANAKMSSAPASNQKLKPVVAKEPVVEKKKDMTVKPVPDDKTQDNLTAAYNKDARVRTGAYQIVGVDRIVTVMKGQKLKSISKAYLGPGMECYVEAINGKSEFHAGDKVKIPKLKIKKRK